MRAVKCLCLFFVFFNIKNSFAQDYFNPKFLGSDAASLENLSYLTAGSQLSPGDYYLYLYSGEQFLKNVKITFSTVDRRVQPCFTRAIVEAIPFNEDAKKYFQSLPAGSSECIDIEKYIKNFDYDIDLSKLVLRLSIPQIYLDSTQSTMAPEREWDDGIAAFMMNYNFNGSYSRNSHNNYSSNFLDLNNRANLGAWRLNANVYFNESQSGSVSNQQVDTNGVYLSQKNKRAEK